MNSHPGLVFNLMRKDNVFIAASICNTWAQWSVHISIWRKLSLQIRSVPAFDANATLPVSPRKPPGNDGRTSRRGVLTTAPTRRHRFVGQLTFWFLHFCHAKGMLKLFTSCWSQSWGVRPVTPWFFSAGSLRTLSDMNSFWRTERRSGGGCANAFADSRRRQAENRVRMSSE